ELALTGWGPAPQEASRRVEAESARQTLAEPTPQKEPSRRVRPPEMPRWDPPGSPGGSPPPMPSRADSLARKPVARPSANLAPNTMLGEERYVDPVFDQPMTGAQAKAQPVPPPPQRHPLRGRPASERSERPSNERPTGDRRSLLDSGLAGLRSALSETSELGGATARSAKSARENYPDAAARDFDRGAEARGQDDMLQDAAAPHMLEPAID